MATVNDSFRVKNNLIVLGTGTSTVGGALQIAGALTGVTTQSMSGQLTSTISTGTAPFSVASTTLVTNLNVGFLNGQNSAYYLALGNATGTLSIALGGTNGSATPTTGGVSYGTGTAFAFTAAGTTSQVLIGGASNPAWSNTPTLTGTNFTGIPNAGLTNSSLTIGSTSVSLGATVTTFTGLTSVTSTTFVGALTGSATQLGGVAAASYALKADTHYIGTTAITLNRASASQALTGITSIDGSAASVANTLTVINDGTGTGSGFNYNGSAARIISFNSIGATQQASYASGSNASVKAYDLRNLTNPSTGIGYPGGMRVRFSALNDDSTSPYADVIDLSTYNDSSGGGYNSLYLNKASQQIKHKWGTAGATSWTVKELQYTDGTNASGTWGISISGSAAQLGGVAAASYALKADTHYIGTTAIALNRASASQSLTGITNIDGTASAWTTGRTFALTGDVTGTSAAMTGAGNLSWATAIADATVTGKVLTGYTAGANTALAATDTILAAMGKIQGQITARSGTVTSVGGTGTVSGLTLTGTVTTTGNLTLGGTLSVAASNFASQTANFALIAPNGSAGVPTFRQLELSDIPDAWTKKSVKAATTANITLSGTQTVDTVALVATDRCLVKDQTATQDNGLYEVSAGAWTRVPGGNTSTEIAGAVVNVDGGTQGGMLFKTSFKSTDTLGTTGMAWYRIVDTSLAGTVVGSTLGTAAIGTSLFYARQDHVHPLQTTVTGNAGSATNIAGGTANQIPYQTGAGATAFYSGANYGVQTYTATGVPSAIAGTAGVLQGSASAIPAFTTTPTLTGTNFTGIPNGALTNSSLTIGSTSVALGSTTTTFAGLTSVTSTTFVGALTGSATQLGGVAAASYALKADTHYVGTTAITLNRASAAQSLTGITSIDGTASAWTTGRTFALTGDVTGTSAAMTGAGNLSWAVAIADTVVTGKVLTGYVAGSNTALAATDTILAAMQKIQGQITARSGTVTSVGGTGTVNGLTLTGTVTTTGNLTLGGALSGIGNGALTNSSVTIGSTSVSLGTTVTTFAGLTSVTSTSFVGALTGASTSCSGNAATVTTNANLTGPITSSGNATSVTANAITLGMMAQVATATFLGRATAATGNVESLTGTQATTLLDVFSSTLKGLVPLSGGGTTNFLRADGTWAAAGGGTTTNALTINNGGAGVASGGTFNGSGAITISYNSIGAAPLASPSLTGTPLSTTAAAGTNTTQIATTAFVTTEKLTPRSTTTTTTATLTPTSLDEVVRVTAQNAAINVANPTGTYAENQSYVVVIKDDGTARAITWGTNFAARTGTLPSTTVVGEWSYFSVTYNSSAAKHIVLVGASGGGGGTTTNALTLNNGGAGASSGSTFNGSAAITLSYNTIGAAPLASPAFTGTPSLPTGTTGVTQTVNTSTTALATTAFVVNTKLTPKTQTTTSSATVTPTSVDEVVTVTALAVACNFANPTGTYADNQSYIIAVKDNGTARALTWGANFQARTGTLPNTTVIGEWSYFSVTYNATAVKHIVLQSAASAAGTTTNPVTFNNGGAGSASGITFNGASAITISHNTIGAAPLASPTFTGTPVLTTTTTIGASGPVVGFRDIPITISNAAKTFALVDAGKGFGKDNATAYTYTIPANASVAFPIGTAITVFNGNATSNVTIAITTDTLRLGGTTTTGSRTLAPWGSCTLYKIAATVWLASGAGLT